MGTHSIEKQITT